jgi:hypothetical protein
MVGRLSVVALALCPLGCFIPKDIEFDDFTGTDSLSLTDTLPATITVTSATSIASITATDSATSTTSGHVDESSSDDSSTETDTEGPESVCDPQPEDVEVGVLIDGTPSWEHPHTELEVGCIVTWVGNIGPAALHVGLACEDGVAHTIDVSDVGDLEVATGDTVELSLYIDAPFWANVYVALRKDGELVLAAMDADALPGDGDDGGHPGPGFFAPLDILALHEVCPEEPEETEPCNFICQGCTRDRRLALAFLSIDDADVVFDHGTGQVGDLALTVGDAREHVEVFCTDTPAWHFELVAMG